MRTNKRKHTRLPLQFGVEVCMAGYSCQGHSRDFSLGGAYIECSGAGRPTAGHACELRIQLQQQPSIAIRIHAIVGRVTQNGFAVRFQSADLDSYEHLKQVMLFNCPDPDSLLEELDRFPGLHVCSRKHSC